MYRSLSLSLSLPFIQSILNVYIRNNIIATYIKVCMCVCVSSALIIVAVEKEKKYNY